jgi:hypothetical protein
MHTANLGLCYPQARKARERSSGHKQSREKGDVSITREFDLLLHTRRDSRIARLQMNKQPIRQKLEVYLTADD